MFVAEYHFLGGGVATSRAFATLEALVAWYNEPLRLLSMSKLGIAFVSYVEVDETGLA